MSTPLFQEALIEAKKLREAAANEAKNAVLEAVSPIIKQMIDREISGVILEQEEPAIDPTTEMPPPAPTAPSVDAGTVAPVEVAPASGAEATPPSMPMMTPAVAAAAPPIVSPGTPVMGKIDVTPEGQQQLVIPVDSLFEKEATPVAVETQEAPAVETPALQTVAEPPAAAPAGPPVELPAAPEEEEEVLSQQPAALAEIYRAVNRLLAEQKKKSLKEDAAPAAAPPIAPAPTEAAPVPPAGQPAAPVAAQPTPEMTPEQMLAQPAPAAPVAATSPVAPGAPAPATPAAAPATPAAPAAPATAAQPAAPAPEAPAPDATAQQPAAPAAPAPAPAPAAVQEYKLFKTKLKQLEEVATGSVKKGSFVKEVHKNEMFALYGKLVDLKNKNAISSRVFALNEERLDLLHENLNSTNSYTQILPKEEIHMRTNSLKDFARSLFEGAEGFEKEVGHVDPAGESKGGSAEHAHSVSGNPKGHKAEAEKAPFATKEKSEWPGKPSPESLLEQLEAEIAEMMGEMEMEEGSMEESDMEETVLEIADEEVMMEARKARARLKALREQAEMEEGGEDHLSLTIDLDGVSGEEVKNVNVSLDGEELDVDMEGEEEGEEEMEMSGEEEAPEAEEGEEEEGMMSESRVLR